MTIQEAYNKVYEAIDPRLVERCTIHITRSEDINRWLSPDKYLERRGYNIVVYHFAEGQWSQLLTRVNSDVSLESAVKLALKHLNDKGRAFEGYQEFLKDNNE